MALIAQQMWVFEKWKVRVGRGLAARWGEESIEKDWRGEGAGLSGLAARRQRSVV